METLTAIRQRLSIDKYDSAREISEAEVSALVEDATNAPSSYNLQHWRFVAVMRKDDKLRLKRVAYEQPKVADASVVLIVLGDLRGHEKLAEILRRNVEAGNMKAEVADAWVKQAAATYADPQRARDEAIRSSSLAAMTLMLAAQDRGYVTGPMIGFDPAGVKREFGISDRYVPVMLVTLGYPAPGNRGRKPRLRADEVLAFHRGREF